MRIDRPLENPYSAFAVGTTPKDPMRRHQCAGCDAQIFVNTERPDSYRAMCPDCGDKFLAGELDSLTFYRGK